MKELAPCTSCKIKPLHTREQWEPGTKRSTRRQQCRREHSLFILIDSGSLETIPCNATPMQDRKAINTRFSLRGGKQQARCLLLTCFPLLTSNLELPGTRRLHSTCRSVIHIIRASWQLSGRSRSGADFGCALFSFYLLTVLQFLFIIITPSLEG